jgi:uncharacterized membrane protein YecN with MAPEG domain
MGVKISVTPFYAALLALVYVWLSLRVIRTRRAERIGLGDGNNRRLRRAIRAHGNFVEYAVFALLPMAFAELQGAPGGAVHLLSRAASAVRRDSAASRNAAVCACSGCN